MMEKSIWICGVAMLSLLVGCQAPKESESIGRQLYMTHCSSCHGLQGRGDGPVAATLKEAPEDLSRIAFREGGDFPFLKMAEHIDGRSGIAAHGTRTMPVWGKQFGDELKVQEPLKEEMISGQLLHLITYLESIQSYH
jgi:mono/diheme cytochrome c family protein